MPIFPGQDEIWDGKDGDSWHKRQDKGRRQCGLVAVDDARDVVAREPREEGHHAPAEQVQEMEDELALIVATRGREAERVVDARAGVADEVLQQERHAQGEEGVKQVGVLAGHAPVDVAIQPELHRDGGIRSQTEVGSQPKEASRNAKQQIEIHPNI